MKTLRQHQTPFGGTETLPTQRYLKIAGSEGFEGEAASTLHAYQRETLALLKIGNGGDKTFITSIAAASSALLTSGPVVFATGATARLIPAQTPAGYPAYELESGAATNAKAEILSYGFPMRSDKIAVFAMRAYVDITNEVRFGLSGEYNTCFGNDFIGFDINAGAVTFKVIVAGVVTTSPVITTLTAPGPIELGFVIQGAETAGSAQLLQARFNQWTSESVRGTDMLASGLGTCAAALPAFPKATPLQRYAGVSIQSAGAAAANLLMEYCDAQSDR